MRILALAISMALTAQPAWAHHKPNHPDFRTAPISMQIERDPCGASNNPHVSASERALAERCRSLRAELRRTPGDAGSRERCDRAARALTGRSCDQPDGAAPVR